MRRKISGWRQLSVIFFLFFLPACGAVLVNRTIDDSFGDPVTGFKPIYQPSGAWTDQTCSGCAVKPDTSLAFDGTWKAGIYAPEMKSMSITLEFPGVAIWVFFILANANEQSPSVAINTQCNFTLDGQYAGSFTHLPDTSTSKMQYNAMAFSRSGLQNTTHRLVIATNDYPFGAFVNFDYAIYTADVDISLTTTTNPPGAFFLPNFSRRDLASSSSTSSTKNIVVTVASVLSGLALLIILISSFLIWRLSQPKKLDRDHSSQRVRGGRNIPLQSNMYSSSEQLGSPSGMPRFRDGGSHSRSPSSLDNNSTPFSGSGFSPVRRNQEPLPTGNQEKLRAIRQREINERLQLAEREMNNLTSRQSPTSEGQSSSSAQEMASLREQVQELRDQIGNLQTQRNSDWALGLTDEQPPAYA